MTLGTLDRRTALMLVAGVLAVLALRFVFTRQSASAVAASMDSIPVAERRLARLRQVAATVPGKQALLKQVSGELAAREKGTITVETAAQAQAQLLEVIRRVGQANGIDARGAEEWRVRPLAVDYGEVSVAVSFTCRIEQLVNFLASLANEPELLATNEIRISAANPKEKAVLVRLSLSGVIPKKLVPEKNGLAAF
jgi:hypothetical protein